ncbi:NADPH-dependent FMN reductase [Rhizobium sp. L1K21]|uniref:NADPH-dependent FMN reductase n=1 Tax=Rhizobium sp. L1K21 TaxID=2954933 RepID=UPI002091F5B2|nr:NADPH-dependent FMN reductase [Rhizobium sp. L1K21]MCO6184949.1 NAD(P)H-dependent oxidoreductase [Rhizobium sp. L1K21]
MRFYAISGSVRAVSVHSAMLRAFRDNAPDACEVVLCDLLESLPIFNPDREGEATPQSVLEFAHEVGKADALIVAAPEYAHGIPGGLKNALDWLVSRPELIGKPVLLAHAYSHGRGHYGLAALEEVLKTASLQIAPNSPFSVPLVGRSPEETKDILSEPAVRRSIRTALEALRQWVVTLS